MKRFCESIFYLVDFILTICLFSSCSNNNQEVHLTLGTDVAQKAAKGEFGGLMCQAFVLALCIILAVYLLAQGIYKLETGKCKGLWNFLERHITWLFVPIWIFGFSIYEVGMFIGLEETSDTVDVLLHLLGVAPMAVIHTFGMFLIQSNIGVIHGVFRENLLFMVLFSLVHFSAAFVSLLFIIKHFGYNLVAAVRLWLESHGFRHCDHLFVFWGMNDATYYLARDINNEGTVKETFRSIFVLTDDDKDRQGERTGINRMFHFLSFKNEELDRYKELQIFSTNSFNRLSRLDLSREQSSQSGNIKILGRLLGLKSLIRLIGKTDSKVHFFILGDDEKSNVKATANLRRDETINKFAEKEGHNVFIYCQARRNNVNRIIEDVHSNSGIDIRIVDPAYDSINILKMHEEYHPVQFVDIDTHKNLGTVKSAFNSLIVGFGWIGRDAVRFLYEYGAFVSSQSTQDDYLEKEDDVTYKQERSESRVMRSDFHCHVIDNNADKIKGMFQAQSPAMFSVQNRNMLDINQMDINSEAFYNELEKWAPDLNYVVVALGDDEKNITTAVQIFRFVSMHKTGLYRFKIFVYCQSTEFGKHFQKIADYYNQINTGDDYRACIVIFGTTEQIYSYNNIVENIYEKEGVEYNAEYCSVSGNKGEADMWFSRHKKMLLEGTLESYAKLRRQEYQDVSNAYHSLTKLEIIKQVVKANEMVYLTKCLENKAPVPSFIRKRTDLNTKQTAQIVSKGRQLSADEELLLRNIARLEHIRWTASYEVLGYSSYEEASDNIILELKDDVNRCNETFRLHNCLVAWQDLDRKSELASNDNSGNCPDYKMYDYAVVTTTLQLNDSPSQASDHNR